MKKIILIVIVLILASCANKTPDPPPFRDASTQFVVVDILDRDGMEQMTSYQVEVIDANNLVHDNNNSSVNLSFWFCDSIGKYMLGQPIHFDKRR